MSSKITAATAQIGAAVVVPVALGLGLAAVTLTSALADARTGAESSARAQVARSVTVVRTEIRNQLAAARTNIQPGVRTVTAAGLPRAGSLAGLLLLPLAVPLLIFAIANALLLEAAVSLLLTAGAPFVAAAAIRAART